MVAKSVGRWLVCSALSVLISTAIAGGCGGDDTGGSGTGDGFCEGTIDPDTGACTPLDGCTGGTVECNGSCVDVDTDAANCGSCGHTCDLAAGYVCHDRGCCMPPNC